MTKGLTKTITRISNRKQSRAKQLITRTENLRKTMSRGKSKRNSVAIIRAIRNAR